MPSDCNVAVAKGGFWWDGHSCLSESSSGGIPALRNDSSPLGEGEYAPALADPMQAGMPAPQCTRRPKADRNDLPHQMQHNDELCLVVQDVDVISDTFGSAGFFKNFNPGHKLKCDRLSRSRSRFLCRE
jgi:hypothetical protein